MVTQAQVKVAQRRYENILSTGSLEEILREKSKFDKMYNKYYNSTINTRIRKK